MAGLLRDISGCYLENSTAVYFPDFPTSCKCFFGLHDFCGVDVLSLLPLVARDNNSPVLTCLAINYVYLLYVLALFCN